MVHRQQQAIFWAAISCLKSVSINCRRMSGYADANPTYVEILGDFGSLRTALSATIARLNLIAYKLSL